MERAVLSASRVVSSRQGSRSRGSDTPKRRVPDPDEVKDISTVADKDVAIISLMRCAMMYTVFAFVHAVPSTEVWVSEKLKENMSDVLPLLSNVSGISLLFFSVASEDNKARFRGRIGGLWSRLCSSAIVLMALTGRATRYKAGGAWSFRATEMMIRIFLAGSRLWAA